MNNRKVLTMIVLIATMSAMTITLVKAQPYYWGHMMNSYWGTEGQQRVQPRWSSNGWYCSPWWGYPPSQEGQIPEGEIPSPEQPAVPPQYPPRSYGRGCCGTWTG